MSRIRRSAPEIIPLALLVLSVLILFWRIILSGGQLYGSDFILQFWPWKRFVYDTLWTQGTLPFWNPYTLSGTPSIANIQASMFYPLGFLYYLIPPEYAYGFSTILHCILGSFFMYIFMRGLTVSPWGAFMSAFIFIFNGYFMAHLYAGHLSFVQNYIWIPLIFFYLHQFLETQRYKWVFFAGLSLGIQILGGFPQIAFYTILACAAFGLFRISVFFKVKRTDAVKKVVIGLVGIIFIGFALAAVQLLPTFEFQKLSGRAGGVSYWFATLDSLHPRQAIAFILPDFFGNPVDRTYWLSTKSWNFWETCGYVGILPLCLVFISGQDGLKLNRIRYFFLGLIIISVFLALGRYNPLYPLIFKLPGFHSFRIPAQILFLYVFSLAAIAGITLHHLEAGLSKLSRSSIFFFALIGIALSLFLFTMYFYPYNFFSHLFRLFPEEPVQQHVIEQVPGNISYAMYRSALLFFATAFLLFFRQKNIIGINMFRTALLAILIIDLGLYSSQFIKPHQFRRSEAKLRVADYIRDSDQPVRVMTSRPSFLSNDGILYNLPTINGYDPLVMERYIVYLQASQGLEPNRHVLTTNFLKNPNNKLIKMLNVRYFLHDNTRTELKPFFPKAVMAQKAVFKPKEKVLEFIESDLFDPFTTVVLESESKAFLFSADEKLDYEGSCQITEYDNDRIRISASTNQSGYLVLSEMYYPGWEAKVDGQKSPVLRGNYLLQVIPLKSGEHDVEMYFVSQPFRIGATISLIVLISCTVALFLIQIRSRQTTKQST
jgi:hypothetical protein